MLKKSITFETFDGDTVSEDHFFHISKAQLVEMQLSHNDTYEKDGETLTGMQAYLQRVVDSNDGKQIIETFKKLILDSYGKKSEDGRRFVKSDALREEFSSSEAYSTLFLELCTNAGAAADFVNGIIPRGLEQEVSKIPSAQTSDGERPQDKPATPKPLEAPRGVRGDEQRVITHAEAIEMPSAELQSLLASGQARLASSEG